LSAGDLCDKSLVSTNPDVVSTLQSGGNGATGRDEEAGNIFVKYSPFNPLAGGQSLNMQYY
jgi:hypothetical protein